MLMGDLVWPTQMDEDDQANQAFACMCADTTAADDQLKCQAFGGDTPLAVVLPLPIGELAPKEDEVRLAVILPLGELLP